MTIYLDEDMIGSDRAELIFPHLLLCMGIVCQLSNGRLLGCHISGSSTEDGVLNELRSQIESDPGDPIRLYMIADFSKHFLHTKLSFTAKAKALNYSGEIYVLDTQSILKNDGAFARLVSSGGSALCNVYTLADEDARPYSMVSGKNYSADGHLVELNNGNVISPRWVKTSDSAGRPGVPLGPSAFKIAHC